MTTESIKIFTPEEAKKSLPLVKKIVRDILANGTQVRHISESLGEYQEDHAQIKLLINEIKYFMNELREIGCYYKDWDFSLGLVDFPAIIDGREVLLCWRSDEHEILFYHDIDKGYKDRKLIPQEYVEKII